MITLQDVKDAKARIQPIIHETPTLHSEQLSAICGNSLFLKGEHLQKTGSFKIRGAANKVIHAVEQGAKYVTAASSGNHGQAVAYVANHYSISATIVVPENASLCKINAIKGYNGNVEKCGTTSNERLPRAKVIAEVKSGIYIPPYDDPFIMAGQGTIGLEILQQLDDIDVVLVPIGGGGLISGILTAIKETKPSIQVIGVEPAIANDTYLSLQNKKITTIPATNTIADGLRTNQPGDLTFPVLLNYLDDLVLVSEDEIRYAFSFVLERTKQIIEPSSATTVAAVLFDKLGLRGKKIVSVISGGNVDIDQIEEFVVDTAHFPK
ncbi:threonine/serine dehydratase [Lysinibacillus sp. KU-BSD001]|uniref:threonine ammonia-lyase n=1 Tax=Lysinibacillus sp. KU-BSD001 TaxID=3141328 RepID=UPI0036E2F20A